MVNVEKIRVTQQSDLDAIFQTTSDIIIMLDRPTTMAAATIPMPLAPVDKQVFMLSTKVPITAMTLNSNGKTVNGNVTTLPIGTTGWFFDSVSDSWFPYMNPSVTTSVLGLGNINNTSDANKPVSTAQQAALDLKANLASPIFTGTVSGITKSMVGLGNVDNTSDASKPISTAEQTALNAKQDTLVSATNIKTVNGSSILGAGNLIVSSVGTVVWARVAVSDATTTGQALVDVTGLTIAMAANAVYEIEAFLSCSTTAVTTGISYGVQFSAAGATFEGGIIGASSTTASKAERISVLNTATTAFLATSAQSGVVCIKGIVVVGANPGNFTIRHLKITSGTSTVRINSYLKSLQVA